MLKEEFEMWIANCLLNATLVTVNMHITNLGYLEVGFLRFIKIQDDSVEKLNRTLVGLNTAAIISKTDDQDPQDLIDFKDKWKNKKKEKNERHQ